MEKKLIFMSFFIIVFLAIIFLVYKSNELKRIYIAEVTKRIKQAKTYNTEILTENDIKHLPEPVQKYLTYVGALGKEKVHNFRVVFDGKMKLAPDKDWLKIKSEQYNFLEPHARLFFIRGNISGIPMVGLHSYVDKEAYMKIKLLSLIPVGNASGQEMNQSETVTVFNDMCLMAPATLIDDRIQWEIIDELTVKAIFNNNDSKISAELYFNEKGELINFISEDRYMTSSGKSYQKVRWSTPIESYKEINGFKLISQGKAIWHLPDNNYCYIKLKLKKIEYNCRDLK